ncbi:MAG: cytochrome-c peroxidase [Flavobacteriales bacterium]|nr:cytochrome-c peroxidase [Flavobacteriales bacterium]
MTCNKIQSSLIVLVLILTGCGSDELKNDLINTSNNYSFELPEGFPEIDYPKDNFPTESRIALGRRLFNDEILSLNYSVSCASCHFSEYSFSDTVAISPGEFGRLGTRNAPPLHNVAYLPYLFKDGGIPNLELQIKAPIEDTNEMNFNMKLATIRVAEDSLYQELAQIAYGRSMDAFVITRSIAAFMRTFISGDSKYDQWKSGKANFTEAEQKGHDLFFGEKGKCSICHDGFNFTNNAFENNGSKISYADTGRARITLNTTDHGKFRVPSLRNIELTRPYMHDGSFNSLEGVVENYTNHGSGHWNQHPVINEIKLLDQEKQEILAFLYTLTDSSFINSQKLKDD